ncbi:hypothetical protein BAE44_0013746 [Dichanthelium oligosanthes]|uniref:VQ domain-containing protein n=1 Tax=Dichanthelium oligosanthes TaxID=888268 RepID=A0A1E5VJE7_9POAL|nr:hypothetical protein BAE44_0013746 [Dichanthelium oligosanthes]
MDHGERRGRAHGAAARPWRGGGGALPPPPPLPKVYRVEPRDFRELVQRLTGAGGSTAAAPGPAAQLSAQQRVVTPAMVAESRRLEAAAAAAAPQQFDYASWYSAPLLSPAYGAPGFGGHQL